MSRQGTTKHGQVAKNPELLRWRTLHKPDVPSVIMTYIGSVSRHVLASRSYTHDV